MKNIIVATLIGGAVVGGGALYRSNNQEFVDGTILSIQGVDMYGVEQKLAFSSEGCEYSNSNGEELVGNTQSQEVETTCLLNQSTGITQEQFACALALCNQSTQ